MDSVIVWKRGEKYFLCLEIIFGSPYCLFDFCGLVVGVVGLIFPPTIKSVAEKSFDVQKTTAKICRNKKPVSNVLFVIE